MPEDTFKSGTANTSTDSGMYLLPPPSSTIPRTRTTLTELTSCTPRDTTTRLDLGQYPERTHTSATCTTPRHQTSRAYTRQTTRPATPLILDDMACKRRTASGLAGVNHARGRSLRLLSRSHQTGTPHLMPQRSAVLSLERPVRTLSCLTRGPPKSRGTRPRRGASRG